jgi:hypothetical protein
MASFTSPAALHTEMHIQRIGHQFGPRASNNASKRQFSSFSRESNHISSDPQPVALTLNHVLLIIGIHFAEEKFIVNVIQLLQNSAHI